MCLRTLMQTHFSSNQSAHIVFSCFIQSERRWYWKLCLIRNMYTLGKVRFLLGGGGGSGPGFRRGGSLVNFLQIGEGQTCFILNRGRVTVFFGKEKITPCRFYFAVYKQSYWVKINRNYLQVSKNLCIKKLSSPNQHNCLSRPVSAFAIFWCFRVGFCDLLLLKPREFPNGAFCQSRNNGESVPCTDKWSKRTGRILAEYYLRIQYIRPLGSGTTLGLHFSTSLNWRFYLFPQPMRHQQSQRSSRHPF